MTEEQEQMMTEVYDALDSAIDFIVFFSGGLQSLELKAIIIDSAKTGFIDDMIKIGHDYALALGYNADELFAIKPEICECYDVTVNTLYDNKLRISEEKQLYNLM